MSTGSPVHQSRVTLPFHCAVAPGSTGSICDRNVRDLRLRRAAPDRDTGSCRPCTRRAVRSCRTAPARSPTCSGSRGRSRSRRCSPGRARSATLNCTVTFAFVPMPSSLIAVVLTALKPAFEKLTSTQHRERQREHDVVGDDRASSRRRSERERVRAVIVLLDRGQRHVCRDLRRELRREDRRDLIVAAADVELLVRLPEGAELAGARVAEQVEHVQRALHLRLGAVLDVVGDVEHRAELRACGRRARSSRSTGRSSCCRAPARAPCTSCSASGSPRRRCPSGSAARPSSSRRSSARTCTACRRSSRAARCPSSRALKRLSSFSPSSCASCLIAMWFESISSPPCS